MKYGFLHSLVPSYIQRPSSQNDMTLIAMKKSLDEGDLEACLSRMQAYIASIPYDAKSDKESRFQVIFYILFSLMGELVETEVQSALGRADLVIRNKRAIYVFEFKVDGNPEEALAQINSKQYAIPYRSDGRPVIKVGVRLDASTRTLSGWKIES
ncbi:MAG: PD-(D/E)XK nuclease domain-containing protein [Tannerella sp.]|nr:PD-(D/E)XK nuclease domain-containing protein [Tannerella sp.]